MQKISLWTKIRRHPLTRIFIGGGIWYLLLAIFMATAGRIIGGTEHGIDPQNLAIATVTATIALGTYILVFRLYEKKTF
jgi:hypothetical protein